MRHGMKGSQSKDHNIGSNRIKKILSLLTLIKNIYLKIDILSNHIFINLLANHMRNNFVKFQKFLTIFVKTVVLFTIFYTLEKTIFSFFNMKEGYSKKCKTKKTEGKDYYQANKKKLQRRLQEYYKNIFEDEKIKKANFVDNRKKIVR